ncbi:MAG: hypothetical protein AVDCRST_MAG60-1514, partial [uncultured Nocardioides sp.]
ALGAETGHAGRCGRRRGPHGPHRPGSSDRVRARGRRGDRAHQRLSGSDPGRWMVRRRAGRLHRRPPAGRDRGRPSLPALRRRGPRLPRERLRHLDARARPERRPCRPWARCADGECQVRHPGARGPGRPGGPPDLARLHARPAQLPDGLHAGRAARPGAARRPHADLLRPRRLRGAPGRPQRGLPRLPQLQRDRRGQLDHVHGRRLARPQRPVLRAARPGPRRSRGGLRLHPRVHPRPVGRGGPRGLRRVRRHPAGPPRAWPGDQPARPHAERRQGGGVRHLEPGRRHRQPDRGTRDLRARRLLGALPTGQLRAGRV